MKDIQLHAEMYRNRWCMQKCHVEPLIIFFKLINLIYSIICGFDDLLYPADKSTQD